jgi:hypothetical protein
MYQGFRYRRGQISRKRPFLWKRRAVKQGIGGPTNE